MDRRLRKKEDGDRLLVGGRDVVDSVAKDIRPVSTLYTYIYYT